MLLAMLLTRLRILPTAILVAGVSLFGCKKHAPKASPVLLDPLAERSWLVPLEVPGFGAAQLAVPLGARRPRPIVVALHGDFDRPEWTCGSYRHAAGVKAFLLCPRGVPRENGRFGLGPTAETARELRAALPALKARFAQHVTPGSVVLAALGSSVEQAITIALQEPSFFSVLVLVDGSLRRFDAAGVTRYGQGGGRRVLMLCSSGGCEPDVEARIRALKPQGVDARLVRTQAEAGLSSEAVRALAKEWPWVIAKDPRWR
jgi:hypothetical protein